MSEAKALSGAARRIPHVLVVDDEPDLRELLELTLIRMGLTVDQAAGVEEAQAKLAAQRYDLCLTDMRMGGVEDGLKLVRHVNDTGADVPIAVITAHGNADNAVAALKAGAFDYLAKPVSLDQLRTLVKSALAVPEAAAAPDGTRELLGNSAALADVRALISRVASSNAPVHVTGESGSGKELAARLIHSRSGRRGQFVAVNCGAIPETLMESEFFGYRKGAFTGAEADRDGFFQAAHQGTLFLDEVADLPLAMQVKLLRVIQEKSVRRVGDTAEVAVDVRIVSATHQNLGALMSAGRFRQDLLYRLNVIDIRMPALRELRDDIGDIANAMLARLSAGGNAGVRLSAAALKALTRYDFPGNVRELENVLERALALRSSEMITPEDLRLTPAAFESSGGEDAGALEADLDAAPPSRAPSSAGAASAGAATTATTGGQGIALQDYLDEVERAAIREALDKTRFNRTAAARLLGVTFRSLRYRLQRLGIE
jgi:two-component system, NtrC family, response regulator PilR